MLRRLQLDNDRKISIVGIAKGSGMIAPNMATMLFIFTDAFIEPKLSQTLLNLGKR